LKIRVDDLKQKKVELSSEEPISHYSTLLTLEEAGECDFTAPLKVHLTVAREYDHIRASGRVATSLLMNCSRCLSDFQMEIDSPFTIFYLRDEGMGQDEDVELMEEDLITAVYCGDEIDFTNEITEQVLLAIPIKPLCSEDCRGLCPACGAELNVSDCACRVENTNLHFNALENLRVNR
jgi:uncharacterized protein